MKLVCSRSTPRASLCSLFALLSIAASGCASRSTSTAPPASAASSPHAAEAARVDVTLALSGEPPLPSQPSAGWTGLAAPDEASANEPAAQEHQGHLQHGGHHHGAH